MEVNKLKLAVDICDAIEYYGLDYECTVEDLADRLIMEYSKEIRGDEGEA